MMDRRCMVFAAALATIGCGREPSKSANACMPSSGDPPLPLPYRITPPPLGDPWVVDIRGENSSRELLARTLQGVVNRTSARMYLIDDVADPKSSTASEEATQHWLSVYASDLGITQTAQGTLDQALAAFASELDGYVLASEAEPWTLNAASTAAAKGAVVVATTAEAPALDALGVHQVDSFVGRWSDASSCFTELASGVGQGGYPGFAVMRPEKLRTRDFLVQQGVIELGGVPGAPEWSAVASALTHVPPAVAIYGYTATDGPEELASVTSISQAGDVLVPSDSAPNLSFHMAVHPASRATPPLVDTTIDCDAAELNVVIGLSDGDNLVVATALYPTSSFWLAPERGRIPIAWSVSPALDTFAPAVLDYYVRTLAPNDELVVMIGTGYAYASDMPNADWYYGLTFEQMRTLGLRVLWAFDPLADGLGNYRWQTEATRALGCGTFDGLLDGYYPPLVDMTAPSDETVSGVPLIRAEGLYSDAPADIAMRISNALATPGVDRPRVVFYSASAWSNDVPSLVAALTPLESQGVRFVSASAGMKCVRK